MKCSVLFRLLTALYVYINNVGVLSNECDIITSDYTVQIVSVFILGNKNRAPLEILSQLSEFQD